MKTIMCFGDSNTHGTMPMADSYSDGRFSIEVRWPGVILRQLDANWHLVEEGHPGRTTVHEDPVEGPHRCGERVLLSLLESHRPDIVIMMLGTNDLKHRFSVTAQDIALSIERLINITLTKKSLNRCNYPSDILVVSPPHVKEVGCLSEVFSGATAKSTELASRIKARLAAYDSVDFFDAASIVEVDDLDGVHLNEESHVKLGEAIGEFIRAKYG